MKKEPSLNLFEFVTAEEVEKSIFRLLESSKKIPKFQPDVINGIAQRDIKKGEIFTISVEEYSNIIERKK